MDILTLKKKFILDGIIKSFELTNVSMVDRKSLHDLVENRGKLKILDDNE